MKIAICDDNELMCKEILNLVEKLKHKRQIAIEEDVFLSGKELIDNIKSGEYYNLIFLDVELGNSEYGSDVGNYLRDSLNNQTTCIVYITSHRKYAPELFKSRPIDFIEKPATEEKIEGAFNAYFKIVNEGNMFIKVKVGYTTNMVLCKDVLYFIRERRKIYVIAKDKKYECYTNFDEIKNMNGFIQIHKSHIINVSYIKAYDYNSVILTDGTVLKISQSHRNIVRDYLEGL